MILAKAPEEEKEREPTPYEQFLLGFTVELTRHVFQQLVEQEYLEIEKITDARS